MARRLTEAERFTRMAMRYEKAAQDRKDLKSKIAYAANRMLNNEKYDFEERDRLFLVYLSGMDGHNAKGAKFTKSRNKPLFYTLFGDTPEEGMQVSITDAFLRTRKGVADLLRQCKKWKDKHGIVVEVRGEAEGESIFALVKLPEEYKAYQNTVGKEEF
jgi:hypothetical protein